MKLYLFITGANGLFGKVFVSHLKNKNINFKIFKRKKNFSYNHNYLKKIFEKNSFTHIINLAAITNVDQSEKKKKITKDVNVNFLKIICNIIKKKKIKLIHFSTDQMYYDYKTNNEDNINIVNYYTKTKVMSEQIANKVNALILRTNFFGKSLSKKRLSFSDWIFKNLKKKNKISLAGDLYFSPLSMNTLKKILVKILTSKNTGIYNLGSIKGKSRYEFAIRFAKLLNLNLEFIKKVRIKELQLLAKRNKDMRMKIKKFEKDFKIKLPSLEQEIGKEAKNYENI